MTSLLIYSIACFGLAFILGQSKISLPLRRVLEKAEWTWTLALLECPACLGFHFGWLYGYFVRPVALDGGALGIIETALFTCGSNFLLSSVTEAVHGRAEA